MKLSHLVKEQNRMRGLGKTQRQESSLDPNLMSQQPKSYVQVSCF